MHWNVLLTYLITFFYNFSLGVWGFALLSPYISSITDHSNSIIGYAEGIQGLCQSLSALPAGYLSDRYSRRPILRAGGVFGYFSVVIISTALLAYPITAVYIRPRFIHLVVGLGFWGVFRGVIIPSMNSVIADTIPRGERSHSYTVKYVLTLVGSMSGPLLSITLFSIMGDTWKFAEMTYTFLIGIALSTIPATLLFLYKDRENNEIALLSEDREGEGLEVNVVRSNRIAWTIALSDIVMGIASGMTVKFFPLFFKNSCGLTPIQVNVLYIVQRSFQAGFALSGQRISARYGRVRTSIYMKFLGIALLITLSRLESLWKSPRTFTVIIPIYVLRTALMNAPKPLLKSVLMDNISEGSRGKWSSLESVTSFGWSGSAVLGGILLDKYGYGSTFIVTALVQSIGLLMFCTILTRKTPRGERRRVTVQ